MHSGVQVTYHIRAMHDPPLKKYKQHDIMERYTSIEDSSRIMWHDRDQNPANYDEVLGGLLLRIYSVPGRTLGWVCSFTTLYLQLTTLPKLDSVRNTVTAYIAPRYLLAGQSAQASLIVIALFTPTNREPSTLKTVVAPIKAHRVGPYKVLPDYPAIIPAAASMIHRHAPRLFKLEDLRGACGGFDGGLRQ
ncbi:hypothetical protein BO70DRAFT_375885 [Aspergillus heteromorphus CBS 117.55]|uniref:Uncharacterized protein n=1 Tax=Aspergillus heteromorphus CBS 117.55 TaxID=1448321 RepID=A0A317X0E7_9EURO|nr:uncharacterized protein BO70DRAFT_375885 [Aspergillus heteromorphus CBS 117.55]PWY92116.1 hypothetical protein BO70DRAFT_375885 [Aspergillus heteromorphus CBS 117.55]